MYISLWLHTYSLPAASMYFHLNKKDVLSLSPQFCFNTDGKKSQRHLLRILRKKNLNVMVYLLEKKL